MHCLFEIKNEAKMVISPLFIQNFAGGKEKHRNNRRNILYMWICVCREIQSLLNTATRT